MTLTKSKFDKDRHLKLVESSFTDYSDERVKNRFTNLPSRVAGGLRSRWAHFVAENKFRKALPAVAHAQDLAREGGGLSGNYQWLRLYELLQLFSDHRIRTVCEFGSGGGSTSFFGAMGLDKFISLEQNEQWLNRTKQCLPESSNVELLYRKRIVDNSLGEPGTRYDLPIEFYKQEFDLIYVDGPTAAPLSEEEERLPILDLSKKMMPNIDIEYFFKNGSFPKYIVVDARRPTVRRLCELYSEVYDVHLRYYYRPSQLRVGKYLYHTIFVRKGQTSVGQ